MTPEEQAKEEQEAFEMLLGRLKRGDSLRGALFDILDLVRLKAQAESLEHDGAYRAGLAAGVAKGREEKRQEMLQRAQEMLKEKG